MKALDNMKEIDSIMELITKLVKADQETIELVMTLKTILNNHESTIILLSEAMNLLIQDKDKLDLRIKSLEDRVKE